MKNTMLSCYMVAFIAAAAGAATNAPWLAQPEGEHVASGVPLDQRYLSQNPPGDDPEVFAEPYFPDWVHSPPIFSSDLSRMYWVGDRKFYEVTYDGENWVSEELVLTETALGYDCPQISADGNTLYFMALSPDYKSLPENRAENIWSSKKEASGWAEPVLLPDSINDHHTHWQFSVAANGSVYFLTDFTGKSSLISARRVDGEYEVPVVLGDEVNDESERQLSPFIATDESYMIFARAPDLNGGFELYISINEDGSWSKAQKLLLANGQAIRGICPNITPDGKFMFYLAWVNGQQRAHWVSTENLQPSLAD